MGFFDFLKPVKKVEYIQNKYYRNYPRKPYISPDRDFDDWEKRVSTFPNMIVQPEMMVPYADGLLPGHIRMLYWLANIHLNRVPDYFEYEHGIDFTAELPVLESGGYISNQTVTPKGMQAIEDHIDFIHKYYPEPKQKGGIAPALPSSSLTEIDDIIAYINKISRPVFRKCNIPVQNILLKRFDQRKTCFTYLPKTPSGKPPKYQRVLHYEVPELRKIWQFGDIWLMPDGTVGKTKQIYWKNGEGIFIYFGQSKGELVLKKVERSVPLKSNTHEILYKE